MRLRTGIKASQALKALGELQMDLGNLVWHDMPDSYLKWTERAETQLRHLFADDLLANSLLTPRYFHIRQLTPDSLRPDPLIQAEIDVQKRLLSESIERLEFYRSLAGRDGYPLVLDTNVFLHSTIFTEVDWKKEFKQQEVRLVVPLIVLDELDDKTFSSNKQLAKRADKVLLAFDKFMKVFISNEIAWVSDDVSIEILQDDDSHLRRANSDSEIIDRAEFLHQVIEKSVTMVTGDRGLRVRCGARRIPIEMMPAHLRWPLYEDTDS